MRLRGARLWSRLVLRLRGRKAPGALLVRVPSMLAAGMRGEGGWLPLRG